MGTASCAPRGQAAMASERGMRASDADRDRSAAALSAHYAAGRLTLEEFQECLNQALLPVSFLAITGTAGSRYRGLASRLTPI
jgi:hypothetical protein